MWGFFALIPEKNFLSKMAGVKRVLPLGSCGAKSY